MILGIVLIVVIGLIFVRAGPDEQRSYYASISSLQFIICAYAVLILKRRPRLQTILILCVFALIGTTALDRVLRVAEHDRAADTPFNRHLYDNVHDAVAWMAADWRGRAEITVSYDFFPEMAPQWWIVAWHRIDDGYRMGMAYDHLLSSAHALENQNRNPQGVADAPDYIVTTAPGSERYAEGEVEIQRFGAVYVLKPSAS